MMNEQELQAFLDQLMREGSEKYGIPKKYPEAAQQEEPPEELPAPVRETGPQTDFISEPERLPEPEESHETEELPDPEEFAEQEKLPEPKKQPVREETAELPDHREIPEEKPEPVSVRRHPVRDLIVGAILVMLSMVGAAALVQCGISFAKRHFSPEPDTMPEEIRRAVLPLVLIDQADFEEPDALTDEQFLSAAVISMLTDGTLAEYPDNLGMRVVPASDITAAGNRLFGTERTPEFRTIGISGELRCYYDKEQNTCLINASPHIFTYVPNVTDWAEESGTVTAKVAYYAEQPSWQTGPAEYIKTVAYTLTHEGGAWQIRAVLTQPD